MQLDSFYRLILHDHQQLWARAVAEGEEIKYPLQTEPLAPATLEKHLSGEMTIGARLLQPVTDVGKAGVIDIDCPRDAKNLAEAYTLACRLQKRAALYELASYLEFSGNRGWHVWLFAMAPLPGATWRMALHTLARETNFTAREIFPCGNTSVEETKSIKLPGGVHLKSRRRCGFIAEAIQWDVEGFPIVPEQEGLMAGMKQNVPEAIASLARQSQVQYFREHVRKGLIREHPFAAFPSNAHPGCIQHLCTEGAPLDLDYNQTNMTIARYALERGLTEGAAMQLAERVADATPESHPTSKNRTAKVSNFQSVLRSATRRRYRWNCSYVLAGTQIQDAKAREARGCIGEQCPAWQWERAGDRKLGNERHLARQVWEAMTRLMSDGQEIRKSTLLVEIERANSSLHPYHWEPTEADELVEKEVLAYLLHNPGEAIAILALNVPTVGFVSTSSDTTEEFLEAVARLCPPSRETFDRLLDRIVDTGLRVLGRTAAEQSVVDYQDRRKAAVESLNRLIASSQSLLQRSDREIQPMKVHSRELMERLFGHLEATIPTPSSWLNTALNGGWQPTKLYVIGGTPGSGKTSFCNWCGDYAASQQIPVLVVSYEMARSQLWVYSLSRLAGIDSREIEGRKWLDSTCTYSQSLQGQVIQAAKTFHQTIAPHQVLLEATPDCTTARLKSAISSIRQQMALDASSPVLVVVDYLQLVFTGDERLDAAAAETLRVSRVATSLKQLARDTHSAILAISDVTKVAYQDALRTGNLDMSALRDSFKIAHAADVVALLQTGRVAMGHGEKTQLCDQLQLATQRTGSSSSRARQVNLARTNYPLNPRTRDTYARLSLLKNRGGIAGAEPLFVYQRALHRFVPISLGEQDMGGEGDEL